jgi:hypothetical protein
MTTTATITKLSIDPLSPTIFHEPWWLDIATQGRYEVAEVVENGKVVGRMPYYYIEKKIPLLSVIGLPPLTHFLGPAIIDSCGKANTRFSHRLNITRELIRKVPRPSYFYIKCHRDITDVVAFQGAGFRTGVQFTHEVSLQSPDDVWANMRDKTRNLVRTARKECVVSTGKDPDMFMYFYDESIRRSKGVANHLNIKVHVNLIRACLDRSRGRIYEARNDQGELVSAIFCAWDATSSYFLMSCRDPSAHGGITCLLIWEAISDALNNNLIFDFDGFVSEAAVRTANNFTSHITPRYTATYESPAASIIRTVRSAVKKDNCFY